MKHGIYYAYWEWEWSADYVKYVDKVARLGYDILEIGGTPLPDFSADDIKRLKAAADGAGIELTVGYGPSAAHNMGNREVRDQALEWYKKLFWVMEQLGSTVIGGALYSYWPIDYTKPVDKEEDWKTAVEGMRILSAAAAEYGVNLNLEWRQPVLLNYIKKAREGGVYMFVVP